MRIHLVLLILALLTFCASAQLERGVKGNVEDVVLVGADDWHSSVAATPLAIWSENNTTVDKTLLILPKNVSAGNRLGWVEYKDLDRYGAPEILRTLKLANVTAIVIHGDGNRIENAIKIAHQEGIKIYVTAGLEPKAKQEPAAQDIDMSTLLNQGADVMNVSRNAFLDEAGLDNVSTNKTDDHLQKSGPGNGKVGDYFCPVNPDARDEFYNKIEKLVEDYKADGVVLYNFGFQDDSYCFCDYCQDKFFKDTGVDLSKTYASGYNMERWRQWKQDQVLEMVKEARNITTDLGPVDLGIAIGSPFDRSQGYNFPEISKVADFTLIAPISPRDAHLASCMTDKPVYIRLSNSYIEYTLSTQNVEGAVKYIEDLISSGAGGMAFEYNVVYTPLWSELEPPSASARWLLAQLKGVTKNRTLGIGNISYQTSARIGNENIYQMAREISNRWIRSPGAVIVGDNYTSGLQAATIASYLNWPVLFMGDKMPEETVLALKRLGANTTVVVGPIADAIKSNLTSMNITVIDGNQDLLLKEMKSRGEDPKVVVMANSRDLSLIRFEPKSEIKRGKAGPILVDVAISPGQIPSERTGEIVRLNISLMNIDTATAKQVVFNDNFPNGRLLKWPKASQGTVSILDPYTGEETNAFNAFSDGSLLLWDVGDIYSGKTASLALEAEILYPLDAGWKQRLDSGITITQDGKLENVTVGKAESWPITNITYPADMPTGVANISWSLAREASYTSINIYSPEDRAGTVITTNITPGKLYHATLPMAFPGAWKFNLEAGDGYTHKTNNYTINVRSNVPAVNITAFSHTQVPRLSLVSAQLAAARKSLLVDVATNPQEIDPKKVEEVLKQRVDEAKISPQYLIVVGDPGSMPFVPTGLQQNFSDTVSFDIYRDYRINQYGSNYSQVAMGRIIGLSVYDASQMVARTLAYDRLQGAWKDNALTIPSAPLSWPQSPIIISIRDYLEQAGFKVRELRWEEATYQMVSSLMNNGQNIVAFNHHGDQSLWALSEWSLNDKTLNEAHVKELTLAPQTTTVEACMTARLKGTTVRAGGMQMYIPMKLDDSIALAFIRAGSLNYVGYSSLSYIHVSEDHHKRFYQALVYENATIGQAVKDADNLYSMKLKGAQSLKDMEDYEEMLPNGWPSAESMMNETLSISTLFGDPCFRPSVPRTPPLPYTEVVTQTKSSEGSPAAGFASASLAANSTTLKPAVSSTANSTVVKSSVTNRSASNVTVKPAVNAMVSPAANVTTNVTANATVNSTAGPAIRHVAATVANEGASYAKAELEASITPRNEMATDWVYWMQTEVSDGKLLLNSPAALIGEVVIPKDAEKVVVKEDGQAVFHDEEIMAQGKKVIWPVIRPKVNETRTFIVEYEVVPGETQIIRITPGWSAISLYLNPKDTSVSKYFSSKPYRGIFTVVGQDWSFTTEDNGMSNVTRLEAGRGYMVDSAGNFTIEVSGKPVELPYRLSLVKGWNLIGVPYNRTVSINSVIVSAEHKRYSYPQAAAKGYVSTFLWKYDGSSWAQVSGNETLEPGKGYLLEAKDDCKLEFRK